MIFPCHLYKCPGPFVHMGMKYRYVGCADEKEYARLTAEGWVADLEEAAGKKPKPVDDVSPPTRDELERKASELGIAFDGRTSDKKLASKIDEALA